MSRPNARYCTDDISNMYLMSDLVNPKYVKFKVDMIPQQIFKYCKLNKLIHNGYIYAKINKARYGLEQSGKIADNDLVKYLQQHRYVQAKHTNGYFSHNIQYITFTLIVDDFGIKYTDKQDCGHLIKIMRLKYKFKSDFEAK